jgi:hypothetical protein
VIGPAELAVIDTVSDVGPEAEAVTALVHGRFADPP